MSKTWYGHHIETIKGYDYVKYEDYLELDEKIEKLQQENLQLKEDKRKARDYIKEHIRIDDEYPYYMEMLLEERDELLEILDDKENKCENTVD